MSRSEKKGTSTDFWITAADPRGGSDSNAHIKIFDGHGVLCASGQATVATKLPKGLYTVRIERFGEMSEDVVVHRDKTDLWLSPPRRNSAMPLSDTRHTHEFFSEPAVKYSTKSTFDQHLEPSRKPRMMIMVRGTGDVPNSGDLNALKLSLYDEHGVLISDFGPTQTYPEHRDDFVIYSALLRPGNYLLTSRSSERVQMIPISLYSDWDSLVFVPFQRRPRLSRVSMKMVRSGEGYNPNDELSAKVDAALLGLGSRLDLLNPWDRDAAIYGKFEHPLLGLIGAHSHFLSKNKKEKLEGQVLQNLWRLMPGSPDVIALLLMALDRDDVAIPHSKAELDRRATNAFDQNISHLLPLSFPPMLNSALQAIMRATQWLPELVMEESWLEAAGNSSFGTGVWSVWDQPVYQDSLKKKLQGQTLTARLPSTQKLYPVIKQALARTSNRTVSEITAQTNLEEVIETSESTIGEIAYELNRSVPEYHLKINMPAAENVKTVRDLVVHVQESAEFLPGQVEAADPSRFRSIVEIDDWLIETVHDHIDGSNFDAGELTNRFAVSKRTIERAAKLPRPPILDSDPN